MRDYTEIEDYDCPKCSWSLHIDKNVWQQFDNHQDILDYIKEKVNDHTRQNHGGMNKLHPVSNNIQDYSNTPFIGYSGSSLTIIT